MEVLNLFSSGDKFYFSESVFNLQTESENYEECYKTFKHFVDTAIYDFRNKNGGLITPEMIILEKELASMENNRVIEKDGEWFIMQEGQWVMIEKKGFDPS